MVGESIGNLLVLGLQSSIVLSVHVEAELLDGFFTSLDLGHLQELRLGELDFESFLGVEDGVFGLHHVYATGVVFAEEGVEVFALGETLETTTRLVDTIATIVELRSQHTR